ncbi:MAG: DUF2279 domain-containing protein [Bacteroidetes bacterium]|nr:DUF2279 domain-containing protein [Bacteroidota bacterium]
MRTMLFALILFTVPLRGQSTSDSLLFGVDRKQLLTYTLVTYTAASLYVEYEWWWRGNLQPFKYGNDGLWDNYSLGVDKAGHFYTSYFYFHSMYELMEWGGFEPSTTLWTSIAIPTLYALSIELYDGHTYFSFSGYDLAANMLGIGAGVLQRTYPALNAVKFKWSYYPSGIIPLDEKFIIANDYDGHIYWMSVDVNRFLPASVEQYWPDLLNIAVGYGARNVSQRSARLGAILPPGPRGRKFVIGLDYDLGSLQMEQGLGSALRTIVDMFRYPAPAVRMVSGKPAEFVPLLIH